jgi:cobalamin biosynthesis protein CbiG
LQARRLDKVQQRKRRHCPGRQVHGKGVGCRKLTEATLVLAELMRSFRVELVTDQPVMPVAVVTTQPDHSPLFRLQRQ